MEEGEEGLSGVGEWVEDSFLLLVGVDSLPISFFIWRD